MAAMADWIADRLLAAAFGKRIEMDPLVWSNLQPSLELAKADVVFILDCCFAANAARGGGSKEGLWACNSEVTTTDVNENSFTKNLIEELKDLSIKQFNIAMLHARLMRRYKHPGPSMLLIEPWYTFLGDVVSPSVQLSPHTSRQYSRTIPMPGSPNSISPKSGPQTSPQALCNSDPDLTETFVLLAVRLKDPGGVPRIEQWAPWCRDSLPSDTEYVHALGNIQLQDLVRIEASFLSHSTLLLVSMPIFIWDRLSSKPAYSFVGFIKSPNRIMPALRVQVKVGQNVIEKKIAQSGIKNALRPYQLKTSASTHTPPLEKELMLQFAGTRNKVHETKQWSILPSIGNAALLNLNKSQYKRSQELWKEATESRKKALKKEHADMLVSMGNMASKYQDQGKWKAAEELNLQVVETMKEALGSYHPDTLTSIGNLASIYWNQGRWKEAEKLEVEVLQTREDVFGTEHPCTLTSRGNLAATYRNQGRWKEAEGLEIQVMETSKRVLGTEHPSTLTSMANLASTYSNLGRWTEAEELEIQVMKTSKRVLGVELSWVVCSCWTMSRLVLDYM